ncbi:MAG: hypothetical protein LBB66_06545 [Desulfovibrio sp.]|jgi:hypothetical protein|nr:hypothetical protein [Desulfovibrio sp.]
MKVQFVNDGQRGRGHACFVCADVIEPPAKFSFSLCRASDMTFLGKSGWQNAEEKHIPDDWAQKNNAAVLYIGPAVVDFLDENENYRLTLFAGGLSPQKAAFSIATINRSLREGPGLVQGAVSGEAPSEEEQTQPPAGPEQQPADAREPAVEEPVIMPPPVGSSNKFPAALAVVLALLLLLGGGFWWYVRQSAETPPIGRDAVQQAPDTAKTPENAPEQVQKDEPEAERAGSGIPGAEQILPGTQATDETPETPVGDTKPAPGVREQVRQFLRDQQASAQDAMTLYRTLSQTPDGARPETQDSVYRLLYFASQKGDVEATFALARCVDPATPVFGTIPKDAREAWIHYAAVVQEKPEAAHAMQTLKAWLENEADRGNALARQWIDAIAKDNVNP